MELKINKHCKGGSLKVFVFTTNELIANKKDFKEAYLEGHLIVIEKFKPKDINYQTLEKAYELSREAPTPKKPFAKDFARSLTHEESLQKKLESEFQKSEQTIFRLFTKLLAPFIDLSELKFQNASTWRSQQTINEGYHLDIYKATSLRAYWNLSPNQRLWGIGHRACDLIAPLPEEKKSIARSIKKKHKDSGDVFQFKMNSFLNREVLKDLEKHQIQFDTYDLWICDGLKACHEIISGDMMAGFDYPVRPSNNESNELRELENYSHWLLSHNQTFKDFT